MSEMRFENEGEEYGRPPATSSSFDMTGAMIRWGLVSTRDEAQYVLIGIAVLAFVGAVFFFFWGNGSAGAPPPPPHMAPAGAY